MPQYSDATKDAIDGALEVGQRAMPDAKTRVLFWKSLWERMNIDEDGKFYLRPVMVAERRRAVMEMFDGTNAKEIAKSLGFSLKTIEHDIADFYESNAPPEAPKPPETPPNA
jgi:DNA-binding NarL/FixJ family response regulator